MDLSKEGSLRKRRAQKRFQLKTGIIQMAKCGYTPQKCPNTIKVKSFWEPIYWANWGVRLLKKSRPSKRPQGTTKPIFLSKNFYLLYLRVVDRKKKMDCLIADSSHAWHCQTFLIKSNSELWKKNTFNEEIMQISLKIWLIFPRFTRFMFPASCWKIEFLKYLW